MKLTLPSSPSNTKPAQLSVWNIATLTFLVTSSMEERITCFSENTLTGGKYHGQT